MRTNRDGKERDRRKTAAKLLAAVLLLLGIARIPAVSVYAKEAESPDTYDLILFFGQRNILGNAIRTDNPFQAWIQGLRPLRPESMRI